jgi:hypothetical protein
MTDLKLQINNHLRLLRQRILAMARAVESPYVTIEELAYECLTDRGARRLNDISPELAELFFTYCELKEARDKLQ